ncbi:hypothetical protein [Bacillus toyonensis]|uniref:hypothetical protein n=1 Tax=Bacillus toyonensis TaxID=155322 RepID=UPI000BECD1F7|nr:hypothetical protein [Bacillus toyonensis]PDZ81804.1 hypothetical protein CON93_30020 [Bacillus toyonensis]PEA73690.1 hypothetical protein COO00_04930 [Bacillus toyonensis]PEC35844.1 hypothetical protein CON60_30580 [Bacillus toyonensis]PEJ98836.1 hypothetical protein CN687_10565 [Bacillus toyonensis]PEL04085.1 hypothetical protein CN614_21785 [Bacillus toyonensis]
MSIHEVLISRANTAVVMKSGNDSTAFIGGNPFKTINGAITAINAISATGITIFVFPGIYDETVVIPNGNSLRGISLLTVTIRQQNVTSNTTVLTMGENTRVEDITVLLTSINHVNLTGVAFPGTTSLTARLRNAVVTVDNSTASTSGTSNVYGIHSFGTGTPDESISTVRASTITTRSIGLGNKRTLLVNTNPHNFHCRDINLITTSSGGSGSYIGAEVNRAGAQLSLRLASIQGPTADISQTAGTLVLSSTNLQNSNANNFGFSTISQPTFLVWADPGSLPNSATRFYRPGTAAVSTTEAFLRLGQKAVIKSLAIQALTGPGGTNTVTLTIRKNGVDTPLTVSLTGTQTSNINNDISVTFLAGDRISLKVTTGGANTTTDTVAQVEIF